MMASLLARPAVTGGQGGEPEGSGEEGPEEKRHLLRESAHREDVALVAEGVDDRARGEEEEGLEEGVGGEVEDGSRPCGDAEGEEHVADLAHRRVGEDPLEVALGDGARARDEEGGRAPITATARSLGREAEEDVRPGDEVDARGDHGRRVDEGAHGRGAGHRVGQPGLQGELGRFARAPAQDERGRQHGEAEPAAPSVAARAAMLA